MASLIVYSVAGRDLSWGRNDDKVCIRFSCCR